MKTQYEMLAEVDKLPYFIRYLSSRYTNGYSKSKSAKWAANLKRRWLRARNPAKRRECSTNDLERYHNEMLEEREHRNKICNEWRKANRDKMRKNDKRYYENNREIILERRRKKYRDNKNLGNQNK